MCTPTRLRLTQVHGFHDAAAAAAAAAVKERAAGNGNFCWVITTRVTIACCLQALLHDCDTTALRPWLLLLLLLPGCAAGRQLLLTGSTVGSQARFRHVHAH
jgi:hypothetical protein